MKKKSVPKFLGFTRNKQRDEAKQSRASNKVAQYFDNLLSQNLYHKSMILELPEKFLVLFFKGWVKQTQKNSVGSITDQ